MFTKAAENLWDPNFSEAPRAWVPLVLAPCCSHIEPLPGHHKCRAPCPHQACTAGVAPAQTPPPSDLILCFHSSSSSSLTSWERLSWLGMRSNLPIIQTVFVTGLWSFVVLVMVAIWFALVWLFDAQSISSTRPWASWWQRLCLFINV